MHEDEINKRIRTAGPSPFSLQPGHDNIKS